MSLSKREARRLAKNAAEMDARVLRGILTIGPEGATVDGTNILEWLEQHADTELMLIAAPVADAKFIDEVRSCHRCGRDYTGEACPHCREVRARLRGI